MTTITDQEKLEWLERERKKQAEWLGRRIAQGRIRYPEGAQRHIDIIAAMAADYRDKIEAGKSSTPRSS